jgi:hypothetical protein
VLQVASHLMEKRWPTVPDLKNCWIKKFQMKIFQRVDQGRDPPCKIPASFRYAT